MQFCPLRTLSTGNFSKIPSGSGVASSVISAGAGIIKSLGSVSSDPPKETKYNPTLKTSAGRSILDIAMEGQHVGLLRYLINEKHVSVYEVENLELALMSVEALVREFPSAEESYNPNMFVDDKEEAKCSDVGAGKSVVLSVEGGKHVCEPSTATAARKNTKTKQRKYSTSISPKKEKIHSHCLVYPPLKEKVLLPRDIHSIHANQRSRLYGVIGGYDGNDDDRSDNSDEDESNDNQEQHEVLSDDEKSVSTTIPELCILCLEKDVDCVAAPCGHRMCCLACSKQHHQCPICKSECYFIEMSQP